MVSTCDLSTAARNLGKPWISKLSAIVLDFMFDQTWARKRVFPGEPYFYYIQVRLRKQAVSRERPLSSCLIFHSFPLLVGIHWLLAISWRWLVISKTPDLCSLCLSNFTLPDPRRRAPYAELHHMSPGFLGSRTATPERQTLLYLIFDQHCQPFHIQKASPFFRMLFGLQLVSQTFIHSPNVFVCLISHITHTHWCSFIPLIFSSHSY